MQVLARIKFYLFSLAIIILGSPFGIRPWNVGGWTMGARFARKVSHTGHTHTGYGVGHLFFSGPVEIGHVEMRGCRARSLRFDQLFTAAIFRLHGCQVLAKTTFDYISTVTQLVLGGCSFGDVSFTRLEADHVWLRGCDFSSVIIPGGVLRKVRAESCTISRINLSGCELHNSRMVSSRVAMGDIVGCRFSWTDLDFEIENGMLMVGNRFDNCNLRLGQFTGMMTVHQCVFANTDMSRCNFANMAFIECEFHRVTLPDGWITDGTRLIRTR